MLPRCCVAKSMQVLYGSCSWDGPDAKLVCFRECPPGWQGLAASRSATDCQVCLDTWLGGFVVWFTLFLRDLSFGFLNDAQAAADAWPVNEVLNKGVHS